MTPDIAPDTTSDTPTEHWPPRSLRQLLLWFMAFRYVKFGLVGASGTVVNLVVLYLAHEHLFDQLEALGTPFASLALAIFLATINNFTWNRLWTWADRVNAATSAAAKPGEFAPDAFNASAHHAIKNKALCPGFISFSSQFTRYALASWFGIALQYSLTLGLVHALQLQGARQIMGANVLAIVVASVSNFLANDRWTFKRRRPHLP